MKEQWYEGCYPSALYHIDHPTGKVWYHEDAKEAHQWGEAMKQHGWVDTPALLKSDARSLSEIEAIENKDDLEAWVEKHLGVDIDKRKGLERLKTELKDKYGDPDQNG